jgi:anti-anti-sigma factor
MAFTFSSEFDNGVGIITLVGELDGSSAEAFRSAVSELASKGLTRLVLKMDRLEYMASAGLRVLVFARQKMGATVDIYLVRATDAVRETVEMTGFHHSVIMVDQYEPAK